MPTRLHLFLQPGSQLVRMSAQRAENAPCALAPPQVGTRLRQYHRGLELVDLWAEGSVMGGRLVAGRCLYGRFFAGVSDKPEQRAVSDCNQKARPVDICADDTYELLVRNALFSGNNSRNGSIRGGTAHKGECCCTLRVAISSFKSRTLSRPCRLKECDSAPGIQSVMYKLDMCRRG